MKEYYLSKALSILESRRGEAEILRGRREMEIADRIPEVVEIRRRLAMTSVELSKLILRGQADFEETLEKMRRENLALQQREKELLLKNGYPADYLELAYQCKLCHDTGYVKGTPCRCLDRLLSQLAAQDAKKESTLTLTDFSGFSLQYYPSQKDLRRNIVPREHMEELLRFCKNYAETFSVHAKGILMLGETGLGKTHLSLAIANRVMEREYTVLYDTVSVFMDRAEGERFGRLPDRDTLGRMMAADLLVLDDLGAEYVSPFGTASLYRVIDTRLERKRPTLISTNLTVAQLQTRYENRLISRLFSLFTTLTFVGKDIRQIKA